MQKGIQIVLMIYNCRNKNWGFNKSKYSSTKWRTLTGKILRWATIDVYAMQYYFSAQCSWETKRFLVSKKYNNYRHFFYHPYRGASGWTASVNLNQRYNYINYMVLLLYLSYIIMAIITSSCTAVDHALSPSYKTDASDKPTSTGKEFIPGSWKP